MPEDEDNDNIYNEPESDYAGSEYNAPDNIVPSPPPPSFTMPPAITPVSVPSPLTQDEMQEMEEDRAQSEMEAEEDAADRMAEQQDRAQQAAEKFADRRAQEDDHDSLFGLDEEDVMGGSLDDLDDEFTVDPEDFEVTDDDIMGGDDDDFSDILEVKQEDVLGRPPAQNAFRRVKKTRGYNPPVNPQLGGMIR